MTDENIKFIIALGLLVVGTISVISQSTIGGEQIKLILLNLFSSI